MPEEEMASMVQFPMRDAGTNTVSQRDEPETFEASVDATPTGFAEQQAAEVVHESLEHLDPPTGAAQQVEAPVTAHADWPHPEEMKRRTRGAKAASTDVTDEPEGAGATPEETSTDDSPTDEPKARPRAAKKES